MLKTVRAMHAIKTLGRKIIANVLRIPMLLIERNSPVCNRIRAAANIDHPPRKIAALELVASQAIGFARFVHLPNLLLLSATSPYDISESELVLVAERGA